MPYILFPITSVCVLLFLLCIVYDSFYLYLGVTICSFLYITMLQWFGILDTWGFIKIHPFMTLGIIAGYFLIGTLWGIIKWIVYVKNQVDEIKEKFRLYCEYTKIPEDASSWNAYKQSSRISLDPPRISSHKEVFFG